MLSTDHCYGHCLDPLPSRMYFRIVYPKGDQKELFFFFYQILVPSGQGPLKGTNFLSDSDLCMCTCPAGQRSAGAQQERFLMKLKQCCQVTPVGRCAVKSHLAVADIAGVKGGPKGFEILPQFEILQM